MVAARLVSLPDLLVSTQAAGQAVEDAVGRSKIRGARGWTGWEWIVDAAAVRPFAHERFSEVVTLTLTSVAEFASAAGDMNPVHRDPEFAAATRYGRPIASGTHTTALLLGLTASYYSRHTSMVGLEFWVGFRRPIYADDTIRLEWLVIGVTANERLGGDIVDLRGRIKRSDGQTAVGAKGRVLVMAER